MPRKGYQAITLTLKDEVVEALDSFGDTRSNAVSQLVLRHKAALQYKGDDTPEALAAYIKQRIPEFSKEQVIDLIVACLEYLK